MVQQHVRMGDNKVDYPVMSHHRTVVCLSSHVHRLKEEPQNQLQNLDSLLQISGAGPGSSSYVRIFSIADYFNVINICFQSGLL